jgi:hypothetical protein
MSITEPNLLWVCSLLDHDRDHRCVDDRRGANRRHRDPFARSPTTNINCSAWCENDNQPSAHHWRPAVDRRRVMTADSTWQLARALSVRDSFTTLCTSLRWWRRCMQRDLCSDSLLLSLNERERCDKKDLQSVVNHLSFQFSFLLLQNLCWYATNFVLRAH